MRPASNGSDEPTDWFGFDRGQISGQKPMAGKAIATVAAPLCDSKDSRCGAEAEDSDEHTPIRCVMQASRVENSIAGTAALRRLC
jgi:hypothetical protein